jgi:MSHA pilin protein MshC
MIEIIAVLVLIGIMSAVVVSRWGGIGATVETEATLLKSNLRFAQTLAMSDTSATWSVSVASASYTLNRDGSASTLQWPGDDSSTHTFPGSVRVTSGTGTVTYDSYGNPGASDVSITVGDGSSSRTITVVGVTGFID